MNKKRNAWLVAGSLLLVGAAIAGGGYAYTSWSRNALNEARELLAILRKMNAELASSYPGCDTILALTKSWEEEDLFGQIRKHLSNVMNDLDHLPLDWHDEFRQVAKDAGAELVTWTQTGARFYEVCANSKDALQGYDVASSAVIRVQFDLSRAASSL